MSINNIAAQGAYASAFAQKQSNVKNLFSALKAGDLPKAQQAYAAAGLPVLSASNTSPLGRLYQALRADDLGAARQAGLAMQGKAQAGSIPVKATAAAAVLTPAQKAAAAKATARAAALSSATASASNVFALLDLGANVNTWG